MRSNIAFSKEIERIYSFLTRNSNSFVPPLSGRIDISERAKKLAVYATNVFIDYDCYDVGHAAFYILEDKVYITSICVDKAHQGNRIGSNLLNVVFKFCLLNNKKMIELEVFNFNQVALDFYLKSGFFQIDSSGDKILMRINLENRCA